VLPTLLSEFLGRAPELAAISGLVLEHRLLTLTGPGGSGKTRLAIEVGRAVLDDMTDGVAFVPLAAITDPALVANAIRTTLALQENPMRPTLDTLVDVLRTREMLLILDNLEHLLEAGGAIRDLIGRTERLHVLVTSRARLQLAGEREFPVPPLDLPPLKLQGTDPLGYAAIALFVDRARAARPDFELTAENAEAIVALCRRLDGLPLAIELAAARIRLLSPDAILERLGQSLDFLSSRDRDRPDRQRTLVNAIAWSFDLLDEPEQRLLRRLGVFVGGWTLADATAVAAEPDETDDDMLDRLAQLVDQSLVVPVESGGDPRFTMLETIREFARDRLEEAGELEALSERHGERFGQRILAAEPHLTGSDRSWLDGLENDHDNIRAMLTWATRNRPELALRCGGALWRFWHLRGHLREGRRRLNDILAAVEPNAAWRADRAKALDGLGGIAYWQSDFDMARSAYQEALAILRELGDTRGVAGQLYNLGFLEAIAGDYVASAQMYQESLDLYESVGDPLGAAGAAFAVAFAPQLQGDATTATRMLGEVLLRVRRLGDVYLILNVVLALSRSNVSLGKLDEAGGYIREGLALAAELGDVGLTAFALWDAAALLGQLGQHGPAARLTGTVRAFREAAGGQAPDVLIRVIDPIPAARAALGDEAVEAELAAGRLLGRDEAVRLATDLLSSTRQPVG
jgi:predicted ATPase